MNLSDYQAKVTNWRGQLRKNEQKTLKVILIFFLVYASVGLVTDVFLLLSQYPQVGFGNALKALLTLQVTPWATLIMLAVAVVSLLITYAMYDRIMLLGTDSHEVTPETAKDMQERQLYNTVEEMKVAAGMRYMPKVFIIEADYMNAFASGYSEKSAMVAITRGLLNKLDRPELQAVMAHELSHIRHHDIKLTLMVAVLSNIMLLVIDILFYNVLYSKDRKGDNRFLFVIILLRYILPIITVILALYLSRTREYMADAGAVELMRDNEPMARALLKISQDHAEHAEEYHEAYGQTPHEEVRQASYLFDPSGLDPVKSLNNLFSTHPSIDDRLKALGFAKKSGG